jgi:hypothetical protein
VASQDYTLFADGLPRVLAPGWLQDSYSQTWLRGVGDLKDAAEPATGGHHDGSLGRLKAALKQRYPSTSSDLDAIGWERKIERNLAETEEQYAARLQDAWNLWQWGGTAYGLLCALRDVGFPPALVEIVGRLQFSLDGDGALVRTDLPAGSWCCDSTPQWPAAGSFWSAFIVLFPAAWSPSAAEIEQLQRLVRDWKSRNSTCTDIAIIQLGRCWDYCEGLTWDTQPGVWGNNIVSHHGP